MKSQSFVILGAMSGTSMDGLDIAAIKVKTGPHPKFQVEMLGKVHQDYPQPWALEVRRIYTENDLKAACLFSNAHGNLVVKTTQKLLRKLGLSLNQVLCLTVHGQTVFHQPSPLKYLNQKIAFTLQLTNGSLIAEKLGITTVSNMRQRDLCVGGQGAPLAPFGHGILFGNANDHQIIQNMGGIGNVTELRGQKILGSFDTGPGNCWIDAVIKAKSKGKLSYDPQGKYAAKGTIAAALVEILMIHPYFKQTPPKSTGWELFGKHSLSKVWKYLMALSTEDALATITYATALATISSYKYLKIKSPPKNLIVVGGGARNATLLSMMRKLLPKTQVFSSEHLGIDCLNVEAMCFAFLGFHTLALRPSNVPIATGAKHETLCGEISLGTKSIKPQFWPIKSALGR